MRTGMRWGIFNAVGIAGAGVQLAVLWLLRGVLLLDVIPATALAVEAAVLHNFFWHERWTWADRAPGLDTRLKRLLRFHLANGAISILGNIMLMNLFAGIFGMHFLPANVLAILICSLVNFATGDRYVFKVDGDASGRADRSTHDLKSAFTVAIVLFAGAGTAYPAELKQESVTAWNHYVRLTEQRIDSELRDNLRFLALDFQEPDAAQDERSLLLRGGVAVAELHTRTGDGTELEVPETLIHHWRGAVLIRSARLDQVLARVRDAGSRDHRQEDVLESRVLAREADSMRIFLKLVRKKIVTVTYNTEHVVGYRAHGPRRASSRSISTRIVEVDDAGQPTERERAEGRDKGFLWRLNSYWRYEQVDSGVIVECESLSLSRGIPPGLGIVVRPIIRQVARESMSRTLDAVRRRFAPLSDPRG